MRNVFQIQFRLLLLIATFGLVVSCLITNCPRGGKRAETGNTIMDEGFAEKDNSHCIPCGPDGRGTCLSRNVCCDENLKCFVSTNNVEMCRNFNSFKSFCFPTLSKSVCGNHGFCRAKYLCCMKDKCVLDTSCKSALPAKLKDIVKILSTRAVNPNLPIEPNQQFDLNDSWKSENDPTSPDSDYST